MLTFPAGPVDAAEPNGLDRMLSTNAIVISYQQVVNFERYESL